MVRQSLLFLLTGTLAILCGCGGSNGIVGGGQGNSVYLTSITLTPANPTLTLSAPAPATQQFVVIGRYNVGNPQDITSQMTWLSLDPKVATVDAKGVAAAVSAGRVVVTTQIFVPATQKTLQASTVLTVVPQLLSITVNPSSATIAKQTAQQFTAVGSYNDGTQADVTALAGWSSSQANAEVSSSPGTRGLAFGNTPGATSITATLGAVSSSASLAVTDANLISLAVTGPTVPLFASRQFSATGRFDDGSQQDVANTVQWSSSDAGIARVSSSGVVRGLGLGSADITVRMGSVTGLATTVVDASSVAQIKVVSPAKIAANTSAQLRAAAVLKDGSSMDATSTPGIVWSSSNASVAAVGASSGIASATSPGSARISAALDSQSGSATLQVSDATIQSLAAAPDQAIVAPGTTQNVIAMATFRDSSGTFQQDISRVAAWTSDNTGVATVGFENGLRELARAAAPGTANIAAAFSDLHGNLAAASVQLNVSNATLSAINVTPGSAGVPFDGGHQFIATGLFSDGTQQDLTLSAQWSATDDGIAFVSPFGFAAASGGGQTSVAAALGGQTGSGALLVNPGSLIRIDICAATTADPFNNCPILDPLTPPPPISFPKALPYGLIAIGTFTDGSRADLTSSVRWTSSSPATAVVSNDAGIPTYATGIAGQGYVIGTASGHVTISATVGGVSGTSEVIVTDGAIALLTVTPMNSSTPQGLAQQLAVTATLTDNSTQDVTPWAQWTTSDASVAVVDAGGLAYPAGSGTTTVTATLGGASGSTTLTVQ